MRKLGLIIITSLLLLSCKEKVVLTVFNDTDIARNDEMVEVCLCGFQKRLHMKKGDKLIILDNENKQVPYQILSDSHTLIFPANVKANDSSNYVILTGEPDSIPAQTYGRHIIERKDDFAWENDRIAFRMYGPALASEYPSNGVDVWLKRTENLIVNKFYKNDLAEIQSYHVDNGEGLDCYKVAHTLGAGGIAPYIENTLCIGSHYNRYQVTENGPLRTQFKLQYDTLKIRNEKFIKGLLTVTIDAGNQLNKANIKYADKEEQVKQLAAGIFLHDSIGTTKYDLTKGYMAYAENAVSDAGIPSGRSYVGVIIPTPIDSIVIKDRHLLAISSYRQRGFTYYFGAGWSKWGFATDKEWFDYMELSAKKIKKPLRVKIQRQK